MDTFWRKQEKSKPLYPDVEWNRPERRDAAGRLGIIGGNKLGFAAVAEAYQAAMRAGAGQIRVLLPDALRRSVPPTITDVMFAPTNPSGSLASGAQAEVAALGEWAEALLLIGDAGKNSQTAAVYEQLAASYTKPIILTRDAIDLVQQSIPTIIDNPRVVFVASFTQIQRLLRSVYYPKVLTFSVQLAQFVDVLHKFTITYPVTIAVFHADHMVLTHGGNVITQAWDQPLQIWRGLTGARIASYLLWSPEAPLAAAASAIA